MSNLSQKFDQTSSLIDSSVNIKEAADCKKRLNNLILFNLPESTADLPEDQIKEDCLKFKELISNKIMLEPDAVLNIYHLERKKDDTLRPLLVKLRSEKLKWDIIKSEVFEYIKNLKYFKNGMSHPIYVTWDKTVKERQERKKLIAEFKFRKNNGEQNLVIRGNKIIARSLLSDQSYHPLPSKAQDFWASLF